MKQGNIVLVGMPGAGKSTVGVLLAKALGMPFLDTDLVVQQKENKLLQEIIDENGMLSFLKVEERNILEIDPEGHVIATGGSVIYSNAAILHLRKKNGLILYLQLRFDEIERRVNNISSRGIVMGEGQSLVELYKERVSLYEKYADLTVNCSDKQLEEVVAEMKELLEEVLYGK